MNLPTSTSICPLEDNTSHPKKLIDVMAVDEENLHSSVSKTGMDEYSPLLSTPVSITLPKTDHAQQRRRRTYIVAFTLLICINSSVIILESALARIFESAYCRAWYQEHDPAMIGPGGVEEAHCKIPQVQKDVASLTGT
jgi:hypothetical protein